MFGGTSFSKTTCIIFIPFEVNFSKMNGLACETIIKVICSTVNFLFLYELWHNFIVRKTLAVRPRKKAFYEELNFKNCVAPGTREWYRLSYVMMIMIFGISSLSTSGMYDNIHKKKTVNHSFVIHNVARHTRKTDKKRSWSFIYVSFIYVLM